MTYLQFHAVFIVPWLVVLLVMTAAAARRGRPLAGPAAPPDRIALAVLAAHVAAALIYTTPWDNHLVARGVWGYPPGRVWFTIGYVPFEEYLFFVFQTLLTGLFLMVLMRLHTRSTRLLDARFDPARGLVRAGGAVLLLLAAAAGAVALGMEAGTYLGLILVWAAPVLALQWAFGGDLIAARWRVSVPAMAIPTVWLWLADRLAIGAEIWWISERFTTGVLVAGLPIEEMLFFLMTNMLVVFGMTMALHPAAWERWQRLRRAAARAEGIVWKLPLVAWALVMVPVPLAPDAFPAIAWASTIFLSIGVLLLAFTRLGPRALTAFGVAVAFGWAVEAFGSRTGVPFGAYVYEAPGPHLAGVPWLVPLGWWAFTAVALAASPARGRLWLAPAVLVVWDLGLDPLMVSQGFWRFDPPGPYAGVPWVNFAGWYVSGLVLVWLMQRIVPTLGDALRVPLRMVFAVQTFLIVVGLAYFGMLLPAAITLGASTLVMAGWLAPTAPARGRARAE